MSRGRQEPNVSLTTPRCVRCWARPSSLISDVCCSRCGRGHTRWCNDRLHRARGLGREQNPPAPAPFGGGRPEPAAPTAASAAPAEPQREEQSQVHPGAPSAAPATPQDPVNPGSGPEEEPVPGASRPSGPTAAPTAGREQPVTPPLVVCRLCDDFVPLQEALALRIPRHMLCLGCAVEVSLQLQASLCH